MRNIEGRPSPIHGFGGFAMRAIAKDEPLVHSLDPQVFRGFNHSCEPNAYHDDTCRPAIIRAARDIQPGEEVTVGYGRPWRPKKCPYSWEDSRGCIRHCGCHACVRARLRDLRG